jgi:predicted TIM-barrel fold metal-dependent hydrolase
MSAARPQLSPAERKLEVIDCHHHLWNLSLVAGLYPWLHGPQQIDIHWAGPLQPIRKDYLVADFRRDCAEQNVVASVHLQAEAADPLLEALWVHDLAQQSELPSAQICGIHLEDDNAPELLLKYSLIRSVRGVRQILNWDDTNPKLCIATRGDLLRHDVWQRNLGLLQKYNFSFELHLFPHQCADALPVVQRYTGITFILNHAGMDSARTAESFRTWEAAMRKYAACPNVVMKLSGLGMFDHSWTVDSLRPYIRTAVSIFGANRCMFASNFPVDKLLSTYNQLYDAFRVTIADLPEAMQTQLLSGNARRVYRLDNSGGN